MKVPEKRGHDKDTIRVTQGALGAKMGHSCLLVAISYEFQVSCHGRGRGFEPRRPRHTTQKCPRFYGTAYNLRKFSVIETFAVGL